MLVREDAGYVRLEINRETLEKLWKTVYNLDAALQSLKISRQPSSLLLPCDLETLSKQNEFTLATKDTCGYSYVAFQHK